MNFILLSKRAIVFAAVGSAPLLSFGQADGILDPLLIPKFVEPLVIPPAMPKAGQYTNRAGKNGDYYEIAVRQFKQRILPFPYGLTTVWSYGSVKHPSTFNYPAYTIEAESERPVRVKWINDLKEPLTGKYLPHLLTVDQTLHWANPPGGPLNRDSRPVWMRTPGAYQGPVPMVTHVHGAHTTADSDGYASAWYLPAATNIPPSYASTGTDYAPFKSSAEARTGAAWSPGSSVFDYPNDQAASTLWYHDHTLGMTRLNVYAGPAGFYILRGGRNDLTNNKLPGPWPKANDAPGTVYRDVPLAIQDRTFKPDGSLFYPASRSFFDGIGGPYMPFTDVSPNWNPEFFGNAMLVNGKTWPYMTVEPRRYRFRVLNGCNSRFLILALSNPLVKVWQIGAEGGFLPAPVQQNALLMSPAERADIIVDFTGLPNGAEVRMLNLGPDEPYGGGTPNIDFAAADPSTTGQVMKFVVASRKGNDNTANPATLRLPSPASLPAPTSVRQVALLEMMSMNFADAPAMAMLGTMVNGMPMHKEWGSPISERPILGRTETWEIYNFTADAHPIHLHQVQFQVINRQGLVLDLNDEPVLPATLTGLPLQSMPGERGFKDTVIAYPGQVTRVKARFDILGKFVWHCHIVEHEDNEMMRPLEVIAGP